MTDTPEIVWIDLQCIVMGDEGAHITSDPENVHIGYIPADLSDAKDARIAELEAAIKRQAGAARTLRNLTFAEVQHIKDSERKEYAASKTLDSERDANAILTEENEALQARAEAAEAAMTASLQRENDTHAKLSVAADALTRIADITSHNMPMSARDEQCVNMEARATLAQLKGTADG